MSRLGSDPLWEHFNPLWRDLQTAAGDELLLAGGYGLFLKQLWLLRNSGIPTIVPITQWLNDIPRVTKDLDFVVGLDLIVGAEAQIELMRILTKHGFTVKDPRWQFEKRLPESQTIIVEMHAPLPQRDQPNLRVDRVRVKRKPSLGTEGFHGRTNPEAIGCRLCQFHLAANDQVVRVPNPVTWSIMKLTAASDRKLRSEDPDVPGDRRAYSRAEAIKHAQDVCRVVAMTTRGERDEAHKVVDAVHQSPAFTRAGEILSELFLQDGSWAAVNLAEAWAPSDFQLISGTLSNWFRRT